ncbi:MAG: hypothetical protein ACQEUT_18310 [Bacillota bacterium]
MEEELRKAEDKGRIEAKAVIFNNLEEYGIIDDHRLSETDIQKILDASDDEYRALQLMATFKAKNYREA